MAFHTIVGFISSEKYATTLFTSPVTQACLLGLPPVVDTNDDDLSHWQIVTLATRHNRQLITLVTYHTDSFSHGWLFTWMACHVGGLSHG